MTNKHYVLKIEEKGESNADILAEASLYVTLPVKDFGQLFVDYVNAEIELFHAFESSLDKEKEPEPG